MNNSERTDGEFTGGKVLGSYLSWCEGKPPERRTRTTEDIRRGEGSRGGIQRVKVALLSKKIEEQRRDEGRDEQARSRASEEDEEVGMAKVGEKRWRS